MKKISTLTVVLAGCVITAAAQSSFTTITYKEKLQPALTIQLPNTTEVARGTILQKLKETGYDPQTKGMFFWKTNKLNDFYVFNNVQIPELNNQKLDMYFKVAKAAGGDKEQSTVYLMVSKGYDNFVSPQTDTATFYAAQKFLDGFVAGTDAFKHNSDIETQQANVTGAEKKLSDLQKKEKDLSNKIAQLQSDLVNNQSDQKNQQTEIESQKSRLELLKTKPANN
jgi:Skp family chaperone for outer membrane proteins